jgi:hypothetical protein
VGQALFEEINTVVNGGNYGWVTREGKHCFDPFNPSTPLASCDTTGLLEPFAEYDHNDGLAVVGGYVYRGSAFTALSGMYVFGDFSTNFGPTGRLFYLDADGVRSNIFEFHLAGGNDTLNEAVLGFGEDEDGELYLLSSSSISPTTPGGIVARIVPSSCCVLRGNVNATGAIDIADVTYLVAYAFKGGPAPPCDEEGNVNGIGGIDIADVTYLVAYSFKGGPAPPSCN